MLAIEPDYHFARLHLSRMALEAAAPKAALAHARDALRAVPAPNPHGHALAARALLALLRAGGDAAEEGGTEGGAEGGAEGGGAADAADADTLVAEAAAHAEAAIAADPEAADVAAHYHLLGEARSVQARWAAAAAAFEQAARRRPADASLATNLGAALLQAGRAPEAAARFRAALATLREARAHTEEARRAHAAIRDKARRGLDLAEQGR